MVYGFFKDVFASRNKDKDINASENTGFRTKTTSERC